MGLDAPDYFHYPGHAPPPRFSGGMTATSPFAGDMDYDRCNTPYDLEIGSPELNHRINATNLAAQLANGQVSSSAKYGKIFPHLCEDGRYPPDFNIPKTVETIRLLDSSQLERIFQAYRLPVDVRPLHGGSLYARDGVSSTKLRTLRVMALFEYLGAWKIVEYEKLRRW
ncbi:hypothetical protein MMC13_002446 [Lambiella insularis]|nr:hypothetical protein [Lambiella insularis]